MARDAVSEVREALDIVDIVGEKVVLKKAGRNMKGLCPFHQEKTPSFVVFPETQGFHCFGGLDDPQHLCGGGLPEHLVAVRIDLVRVLLGFGSHDVAA